LLQNTPEELSKKSAKYDNFLPYNICSALLEK
jgi:hypothetical protein